MRIAFCYTLYLGCVEKHIYNFKYIIFSTLMTKKPAFEKYIIPLYAFGI